MIDIAIPRGEHGRNTYSMSQGGGTLFAKVRITIKVNSRKDLGLVTYNKRPVVIKFGCTIWRGPIAFA